jgi:hypothetical protein
MHTVGYWVSPSFPYLPDPRDYVDEGWDASERDAVIQHLTAGRVQYSHLRGRVCVMCGGTFGHDDLTDGEWSWPEDLLHYVVTHRVRPDGGFVTWVLRRSREKIQR